MATESQTRDTADVRPRRRKVVRVVAAVIAWLLFAVAGIGFSAHFLDTGRQSIIVIASVAWVFALFSIPALVLHLVSRGWVGAGITGALIVAQVVVYLPLFVAQNAPTGGTTIRVMTQNLYLGNADAAQIVDRARTAGIEVLMLEELTPDARARLDAAGLGSLFPHAWVKAGDGASGSGIWSRYPLSDQVQYPYHAMATLSAVATLPTGGHVTVAVVHPPAPYPGPPGQWRVEMAALGDVFAGIPEDAAVLVGGDFNATMDSSRFRKLLVDGYRDAADQAGAGFVRSWPADRSIPPIIGIDHVLTQNAVATHVETYHTHATDHTGLIASVVIS